MIELSKGGAYLLNGTEIIEDGSNAAAELSAKLGNAAPSKEEAAKNTIAYGILNAHNTSGSMDKLKIKFDKMTSHDITFVGIIQTARASGLEKFPIPYVLTNCHNSLCAVGGTINEDDHMFGLTCAKKYGGIYVPPHQAVIHQFAREMLAEGGKMILGSDSHTRYGALGTMAMGEGGPELVKQLLNKTYDINMPGVVAIYLTGEPAKGVGPQDVALAIIGAVFGNGYVKNKVMEFVGPGVSNLSADFRIGIDVMTTETTCLSSIWRTDEKIQEFYDIHGRSESYKELNPGSVAYYDGVVKVDLSKIKPMIAMPFHPSNTYTIDELNANLEDILHDCEKKALVSLDGQVDFKLTDKIHDGKLHVEGSKLVDQNNNEVQLRGVSTHGLSWYPQYVNDKCFAQLHDKWGANVVRLAMYTEEYNGYCSGDAKNRSDLKKLIKKGVKLAKKHKMYVIVDWHILSDGNPNSHKKEAKAFFKEMSKELKGYNNVIYEICNEPNNGTSWKEIKSYAKSVISTIRENDKKAVIVVGTPTWSQDVDQAVADPIKGDNIMYALHFYAATHKADLRNKMTAANIQSRFHHNLL